MCVRVNVSCVTSCKNFLYLGKIRFFRIFFLELSRFFFVLCDDLEGRFEVVKVKPIESYLPNDLE